MPLRPYRELLSRPGMGRLVIMGWLARIPFFGSGVVVTLHVVDTLGQSYRDAGVVIAALLLGVGIGGPYRGRLLDRLGLARVALPCLAVQAGYAVLAPFVGYLALILVSLLAGLFMIPMMSVMRQAMMAAVPLESRRRALSLDGMVVELSAMLAPALGVWAALTLSTRWALLGITLLGVAAGLALVWLNPPLKSETAGAATQSVPTRSWFGLAVALCLLAGVTSTVIFTGSDLGIIAVLREHGSPQAISWVMALWAAGSLIGGLIYGSWQHSVNPYAVLAVLAALTALPTFASTPLALGGLMAVAGLLGQPSVTSVVEALNDAAPEAARGEAMGWHSTAMTTGSALGSPIAGAAIDWGGGRAGFLVCAGIGLTVAAFGLVVSRGRAQRHTAGPA